MKQLSKVFLSLFMFLSYSPMLMNANAEEESPETTEIPIEIEKTPHEEGIKVMEEEVMDELPKYVDSFIDWIDKETYPNLIHNATGNVYVQMRVKDASYEGMKEAMPKTIYGWIHGKVEPIEIIDWVYCGKDPETNYLEHIITNYAFRPILKEGYSYNPSTVPLLSLHIIEDRPLLRTIHNETSKLKIIRSEYEIPEKYRNFSFGAQTVLERKNINDVETIYKTKYQRFIDGKTRDIWAKETALHVDSGMTSRYGNDQLLAVGAIGNQQNHKGSVTMRYDFYYYDDEENEVPIQLPGFMMIANLDKKSEYWNGTDIPDAVTPQEYEMCYVYEGNYLGINGDRIYGTDLIFAGNNQPEWGSDTWKKMLAIIAFDTSSITLKMEAGYARGIVIDSWEFNYKIETNVQNGMITPSEYGIIPGQNRTIAYTPYKGYELTKLEVDGERISLTNHLNEYSFTDIQENHEIYATFEKTYHIKTEVENGIIDESIHQIPEGESRAIHYNPNPGYILNTIEVDQEKVNQKDYKNEYLFSNITRDHHIKVSFVKQPDPIKKVKDNTKLMR